MDHALRFHEPAPMSEMNTTPLIDVMLVLLIMLIITIPVQTHAVKLDLPTGPSAIHVNPVKNEIGIQRSGTILWDGKPIELTLLRAQLRYSQQMRPLPELHLRPDPDARYETVDRVLGLIKQERVQKVGFVGNEAYTNW